MARRKRRRSRRAVVVMTNPRRRSRRSRRRNPGRIMRRRRRGGFRRRRNPGTGAGIKGAVKSVFMVAVPALVAGGLANFIDAKIADKHILLRIGAKLAQAAGAAMLFRRRPVIAYAAMGAAIGSIGGEFGTRMGGGVVVGGTPIAKAQGVAALITEDRNTMAVLVEGMGRIGYQIDNNVSLGDAQALPAGQYQDVNLG